MRALIQRVTSASVKVADQEIATIGPGLMILVCAMHRDEDRHAQKLAEKISKLRIFRDEAGKMNTSLLDTGGAALVVSQFTLAADTRSGNRPGFSAAANPILGKALYQTFAAHLRSLNIETATGRFGADMQVSLVNDGPVTLWLDT